MTDSIDARARDTIAVVEAVFEALMTTRFQLNVAQGMNIEAARIHARVGVAPYRLQIAAALREASRSEEEIVGKIVRWLEGQDWDVATRGVIIEMINDRDWQSQPNSPASVPAE